MAGSTLRDLLALSPTPTPLSQSVLVMIDCQNTYRQGVMQLEGVEEALGVCADLLARARAAGSPVIHIRHDAGVGSPYDVLAEIGQIAPMVAPRPGEKIITKAYPSAFEQTTLAADLAALGRKDLVLAGFMTHMCVNSTARAAFNHGYRPVVVAAATATRALPKVGGGTLPAQDVHEAALSSLADLFAVVVPAAKDIPA